MKKIIQNVLAAWLRMMSVERRLLMRPQTWWMAIAVDTMLLGGHSLFAEDKQADRQTVPISDSEDARRSREELQVRLKHVAPMKLQYLETGAMIERVPHPVLRFGAPMFGNHHGALWIGGTRGWPVAVLESVSRGRSVSGIMAVTARRRHRSR